MEVIRPSPALPDPKALPEVTFRRLLDCCFKQLKAIEEAAGGEAASAATAAAGGTNAAGAGGTREGGGAKDATGEDRRDAGASGNAGGGGGGDSDSDRAAAVLKMRHYLGTLREQLADLRAQQDTLGIDGGTLDLYDTYVKAVAAAVPKVQLPPYCQKLVTGGAAAAAAAASASAAGGSGRIATPNMSYFTPPPARPGVTPTGGAAAGSPGRGAVAPGASGPNGSGAGTAGLSETAAARLREAEAAQALLTDELAELTAALKANATGMALGVAERGRLLEATEGALGDSLAATQKNAAAAKAQVKRSGGNLCFTCLLLLVVGLVFAAMVVYIKFTHLLGYRAPAFQAAAPPAAAAAGGRGVGGGSVWQGVAGGGGVGGGAPWGGDGEL